MSARRLSMLMRMTFAPSGGPAGFAGAALALATGAALEVDAAEAVLLATVAGSPFVCAGAGGVVCSQAARATRMRGTENRRRMAPDMAVAGRQSKFNGASWGRASRAGDAREGNVLERAAACALLRHGDAPYG